MISNTASIGDSGGVFANAQDDSLVDLRNGLFERNKAGDNGGGMFVSSVVDGGSLRLDNSRFLSNTANGDGGGIYFEDGIFESGHVQ